MQPRIDKDTAVVARFHPERSELSLDIYNAYLQEAGVDAIYLLFHNREPRALFEGMRNLDLAGAVVAGSFETDPRVLESVDQLHPLSERLGAVGAVTQNDGRIWGTYQNGFALDESIRQLTDYSDKKMVILGAGMVARALLLVMDFDDRKPNELEIYNRTISKAEAIAREFTFVHKVSSIEDMLDWAEGDILVNATHIGSVWNRGPAFRFPDEFVARFDCVVDVVPLPLRPQLIATAEKLGKHVSPGHRMFTHQAKYSLETILRIEVDEKLLSANVLAGLRKICPANLEE